MAIDAREYPRTTKYEQALIMPIISGLSDPPGHRLQTKEGQGEWFRTGHGGRPARPGFIHESLRSPAGAKKKGLQPQAVAGREKSPAELAGAGLSAEAAVEAAEAAPKPLEATPKPREAAPKPREAAPHALKAAAAEATPKAAAEPALAENALQSQHRSHAEGLAGNATEDLRLPLHARTISLARHRDTLWVASAAEATTELAAAEAAPELAAPEAAPELAAPELATPETVEAAPETVEAAPELTAAEPARKLGAEAEAAERAGVPAACETPPQNWGAAPDGNLGRRGTVEQQDAADGQGCPASGSILAE